MTPEQEARDIIETMPRRVQQMEQAYSQRAHRLSIDGSIYSRDTAERRRMHHAASHAREVARLLAAAV